jgi:hypothetical protein
MTCAQLTAHSSQLTAHSSQLTAHSCASARWLVESVYPSRWRLTVRLPLCALLPLLLFPLPCRVPCCTQNILLLDLKKQFHESQQRLAECEHNYEYIKNLGNRLINLTQSKSLALSELKEKIKIKQNEEEILKNESRARQRALQDQARQIKIAQNFLAAYKLEQNKYKTELKSKKDTEDQHNMDIQKLLSIVELYTPATRSALLWSCGAAHGCRLMCADRSLSRRFVCAFLMLVQCGERNGSFA